MDIVWRHCFSVHSPTSENMSATMLAFILRSKGASLKNLYFGRGVNRELKDSTCTKAATWAHCWKMKKWQTSDCSSWRLLAEQVAQHSQKCVSASRWRSFETYFTVTRLRFFFCFFSIVKIIGICRQLMKKNVKGNTISHFCFHVIGWFLQFTFQY